MTRLACTAFLYFGCAWIDNRELSESKNLNSIILAVLLRITVTINGHLRSPIDLYPNSGNDLIIRIVLSFLKFYHCFQTIPLDNISGACKKYLIMDHDDLTSSQLQRITSKKAPQSGSAIHLAERDSFSGGFIWCEAMYLELQMDLLNFMLCAIWTSRCKSSFPP